MDYRIQLRTLILVSMLRFSANVNTGARKILEAIY
jgi:hypothetical protein